jgi:hypothetical protein
MELRPPALRQDHGMDADAARTAAHLVVLEGLQSGAALDAIELGVARCRVRGVYEPDLAMLEVIIAALDVAQASRAQPLDSGDWPARYLTEVTYRNRHTDRERLTYALYAAAAFRAGLRPDVLTDTYGWSGASLLPYATRAAVMTIRAVADGQQLEVVTQRIAAAITPLEP